MMEQLKDLTPHEIDEAITDGLKCPSCGSDHFWTVQQMTVMQEVTAGEWQAAKSFSDDNAETRQINCASCGALLWVADPAEEVAL